MNVRNYKVSAKKQKTSTFSQFFDDRQTKYPVRTHHREVGILVGYALFYTTISLHR